jgi:hypothetical protein
MRGEPPRVPSRTAETGLSGFGGYGARECLLSFDPSAPGSATSDGDGQTPTLLPELVSGEASREERARFRDRWHARVEAVLTADLGPDGLFAVETA